MRDDNYLFCRNRISDVLENENAKVMEDIDSLGSDRILNSQFEDLVKYFKDKYYIEPVILHEDKIYIDQSESKIDVSNDFDRAFISPGPHYIAGVKVDFFVPFDGDKALFLCQPSTFSINPPRADIRENEVVISISKTNPDSEQIKKEFESCLETIKTHINRVNDSVREFDEQLESNVRNKITSRQEKLKKDQNLANSFGFPLKKREETLETYIVPTIKKKIIPQLPPTRPNTPPEPVLDMNEYENILKIISNMVTVMERSPKAFIGMEEEDLRTHFLVQLNGQYEGQATGETFNSNGKTDILIRTNNKNIFIAECKFWKGEEGFKETINQILGYTSWRDTKTAILLFNRNKNTSNVLSQIPEILKFHPNFSKEIEYQSETGFRVAMKNNGDNEKELTLTVLVFDIPIE